MSKRKPEPVVEEWAEERGAVTRQLARMAADTPGPSNPDVMFAGGGDGSEPAAYVKLFKLTEDGKHHAAVKFGLTADLKKIAQRAEPEVVGYKPTSVLEYLEWLSEKPAKWLKDEICRVSAAVPRGSFHRALKSYLAALYQRDLASTQDERWKMLNERVEKHRFLADLPGLSESDFFIHAMSGELTEDVRRQLLKTHTREDDVADDVTMAELKDKAAPAPKVAPAAQSEVAKMKAEAVAKKAAGAKPAAKPVAAKTNAAQTTVLTATKVAAKPAPKAAPAKAKPAAKKAAKPKVEKVAKAAIAWQKLKKDDKVKYIGKNKTYAGKTFKVVKADKVGVTLAFGDKMQSVSHRSVTAA